MMKIKKWIAYLIKHVPLVQRLYVVIFSTAIKTIGVFLRTDDKLVLFSSYSGEQYSDSPKVLFEAMRNDPRFSDCRFVWAFEDPDRFCGFGFETVKIDSIGYFTTALRAKIWITNVNIERGLNFKRKETVYLNTWHGTGPKKGGNAVKGRKDYDFSRVDILCCDGKYLHDIFVKWWDARERSFIWCGRPREDELLALKKEDTQRIREKLGVPAGKKAILYMPTWREYEYQGIDVERWREELGNEYVLLARAHHIEQRLNYGDQDKDFFFDVTQYENVNELYWVSDILISDYSSAFFDFGLLAKPMYCLAKDYEQFRDTYGLFIDLESDFPNGVKKSEHEVISAIQSMDYAQECEKIRQYCAKYVSHRGNATASCIDAIASLLRAGGKDENT